MNRYALGALAVAACAPDYELVQGPVDVDPGDVLECPFSPIPGTRMSVYDCNPVFSGTDEDWGKYFVSVGFRTQTVLGHPFYQIWYAGRPTQTADGGNYGLGYAISSNGTDWEAHPENPLISEDGGWDADNMDAIVVLWDDVREEYVLAYQGYDIAGGTWGMGVYTSPDGIAWTAYADGNRVLDFSRSIDGVTYCWPLTLTHVDGYVGYLAGQPSSGQNVCQMYAFASDELQTRFEPTANAVLQAGPEAYDQAGMVSAAVVELDGTWYMFYVGFEYWEQMAGYQVSHQHQLNLATSTDGVTWEKWADNPFPVALGIGEGQISSVAAQVVGSRVHLWVTDQYPELDAPAVGYYLYEPGIDPHP